MKLPKLRHPIPYGHDSRKRMTKDRMPSETKSAKNEFEFIHSFIFCKNTHNERAWTISKSTGKKDLHKKRTIKTLNTQYTNNT